MSALIYITGNADYLTATGNPENAMVLLEKVSDNHLLEDYFRKYKNVNSFRLQVFEVVTVCYCGFKK